MLKSYLLLKLLSVLSKAKMGILATLVCMSKSILHAYYHIYLLIQWIKLAVGGQVLEVRGKIKL